MESIFNGAKFGDKFLTRTNLIAIFVKEDKNGYQPRYKCIINDIHNDEYAEYYYHKDGRMTSSGEDDLDIVSRYQEPIDEEKLNKLAEDSKNNIKMFCSAPHVFEMATTYENGFKNGYRKAMEE